MNTISIVERAVSHSRENGKFIVVYKDQIKQFKSLLAAFLFYYELEEDASLCDVTKNAELLERKIKISI